MRASLPLGVTLGRMTMSPDIDALDHLFLAQARRRVNGVLLPTRIGVRNLAQELATLAERKLIPASLRDNYRQVATLLADLVTAVQEAEDQAARIMGKAVEALPPLLAPLTPDHAQDVEAGRVSQTLEVAEGLAQALLQQSWSALESGGWEAKKAHAHARVSLLLDPRPEHQHYWLEDTDFNLLELPASDLCWSENGESEWGGRSNDSRNQGESTTELGPHGQWLRHLLSHSVLKWEQLPLIQTIYVDFDLGAGMEVPGSGDASSSHRLNPGSPSPP